jgi:ubiquinone/menaquinone biosynthesis C-methylase UbiE
MIRGMYTMEQTTQPGFSAEMFTHGITCHALLVIHSVGLLSTLEQRPVSEDEIYENERFPHPLAVIGALQALTYGKIVEKEKGSYFLTEQGKEVTKEIDYFLHWFLAYGNVLAHSVDIAHNRYEPLPNTAFSFDQVAYSASLIKKRLITPVLKNVLTKLKPQGTLADVGCSSGELLISLCNDFGIVGIGFEKSPDMVELANKNIQLNTTVPIHAHYIDYMNIKGTYPDVDIVISDFFTHHVVDDEDCTNVLQSLKTAFPNSRYLLFMDNYTPENNTADPQHFAPAFDFVHRLQGIETRNLKSLERILENSGFPLVNRLDLEIPNSYLWILEMKNE